VSTVDSVTLERALSAKGHGGAVLIQIVVIGPLAVKAPPGIRAGAVRMGLENVRSAPQGACSTYTCDCM